MAVASVSSGGKRLRVGLLNLPQTLNPGEAPDSLSSMIAAQVFETPYRAPTDDGPAPAVLFDGPLSVEPASDGVAAYTGRLRSGILFSDGTPLTSHHVADSLARVDAVRTQAAVEARGDQVAFTLKIPNARFELALSLMHCGIVLEKGGRLLGTGPFVLAEGASARDLRFESNARHRGRVDIERLEFVVYPPDEDGTSTALMAAIEAGEVDFTTMLSRKDAQALTGVSRSFQPAVATAVLYFNTERPTLDDPLVRKGLSLAIDRLAVAQISYPSPLPFAATSLLPSMMGMAHDGLTYDLGRARSLLDKAKGITPSRLRMLTVWAPRPYLPNPQPVARLVAEQLAALGVAVEIEKPATSRDFFNRLDEGDYDLLLGGWIGDTPDPADFLEANLRSDHTKVGPGSFNMARFRSDEMDAALRHFREDSRPEHRNAILELLNTQAPLLPLMYGPNVIVHSRRVSNVVVSPLGVPQFGSFALDGP